MNVNSSSNHDNAAELESLLAVIQPKILEFIKSGEITKGKVPKTIGSSFDRPDEVKKALDLESYDYSNGESGEMVKVVEAIDKILHNSINTWHPGFLDKLYAGTNPIGVISDLILSVLNTNSHVFTVSPALTIIEKFISHEYAKKFGFDGDKSGGLTFAGGSWSNVTSLQLARSILFPETKTSGVSGHNFAIYTSLHSHYSVEKLCILLGFGKNALFKVKVNDSGEMDTLDLEKVIKETKEQGFTPLYINATAGTTVFGSFDNFTEVSKILKLYNVWFHIDGSWGGNVCFSEKQRHKLEGSHLADSITSNPHKMLGVPTTCSFLLVPDKSVFKRANSLDAPYLFHNSLDDEENYDLGDGTMGCGRRADSLKLYLSWLYYGENGFSERVDHAFEVTSYFASKILKIPSFKLVSEFPPPCLQVCFYYNPQYADGVSVTKAENTKTTRVIAKNLFKSGKFLVDYAPNPDASKDEGEFFRVVFNSPSVTFQVVDELIEDIMKTVN